MPPRLIQGYVLAVLTIIMVYAVQAFFTEPLQGQLLVAIVLGMPVLIGAAMSIGTRMPMGLLLGIACAVPPIMIFFASLGGGGTLYYFVMLLIMPAMAHLMLKTFVPTSAS